MNHRRHWLAEVAWEAASWVVFGCLTIAWRIDYARRRWL